MLLNCDVGEDSWEFFGLQEIKPVHPKGNQTWIFIGRLMLKLKLQYFGDLMGRTDSLKKTLMLGKIEGRREGDHGRWDIWIHHRLDGHEFEQALGVGDGQGSLASCSPWVRKESDMTEQLNWLKQKLEYTTQRVSPKVNYQFNSVQSLSHVRLFANPWIAAHRAPLSITNSWSSLRLTSIESVMPSSHLILCHPLLLLPPIPPSISLFQWVNSSHEVAKVLEFQL